MNMVFGRCSPLRSECSPHYIKLVKSINLLLYVILLPTIWGFLSESSLLVVQDLATRLSKSLTRLLTMLI